MVAMVLFAANECGTARLDLVTMAVKRSCFGDFRSAGIGGDGGTAEIVTTTTTTADYC